MLIYTHTYLLDRARQLIFGTDHPGEMPELAFGNVIPDFIPHLGKDKFQPLAHDLHLYEKLHKWRPLTWGGYFHILCDNVSTLGKPAFAGGYHEHERNGFIEKLAHDVIIPDALHVPPRRILQCALDILVLRHAKNDMMALLQSGVHFLLNNTDKVSLYIAKLYGLQTDDVRNALLRFNTVYGDAALERSAIEIFRLFPLVRAYCNVPLSTDPQQIYELAQANPILMEIVESNLHLLFDNWQQLLDDTVHRVVAFGSVNQRLLQSLHDEHERF